MNRGIKLWSAAGVVAMAFSCSEPPWDAPHRLKPGPTKKVIVVSTTSPQTVFRTENGDLDGLAHATLTRIAGELGLLLEWRLVPTDREAWRQVRQDRAHISLIPSPRQEVGVHALPLSRFGKFRIVCAGPQPKGQALQLRVADSSPEHQFIQALPGDLSPHTVELVPQSSSEVLIATAQSEEFCTVAELDTLQVHQSFLPELQSVHRLKGSVELAWHVAPSFESMAHEIHGEMQKAVRSGELTALRKHHRESVTKFNVFEARVFLDRMKTRLPYYEELFREAGELTGFPWQLIAALSYQESHWSPQARSYTGVEGMMMLTLATAREMGVRDRKDPEQAIAGGAKYLRKLYSRLPEHITGADRLAMALASYNVGYGHLQDARMLAVLRDKNPNRWTDLKEVLPLLSHHRHTQRLRYGTARGQEPVQFVTKIHFFWSLLESRRPPEPRSEGSDLLYAAANFAL